MAELYDAYDLILLDVDGTLRECTVPGQPCPNRPGEQRLLTGARSGVLEALRRRRYVDLITNQAGVALGYTTAPLVRAALDELGESLGLGARAADVPAHICFHHPNAGCACRKPQPGMLFKAMLERDVPPRRTLFVGDQDSDADAARAAGVQFMPAEAWRDVFKLRTNGGFPVVP